MSDQSSYLGQQPRQVNLMPFGAGAALFALLFAVGNTVGGEVGQFMAASLNALPFAVLAVLAYLGGSRPNWAWVATGLWLALMVGGASLAALGLGLAALADGSLTDPRNPPSLVPGAGPRIALLLGGVVAGAAAGAALLIPALRRALARVLPLNPDSFVHTTALVAVVAIGLICTVPLVALGEPPLLRMLDELTAEALGRDAAGMLRDQFYGLVWLLPLAVLAVGFGITRDLPAALVRLGLVRPSLRQVAAALGIALLLVGAVQLVGLATNWLWGLLGWPVTDEEAFGELLAFAISPLGALVIGVTAGLGEEVAVRGALQPRLGLLLSNLFFMSLHALQYSWDALLIVFLVGVACGLVRRYSNTTTAAIVHGTYNFTLIMLAVAGVGG